MAKIKLVGPILDNDSAMIYSWWGFDAIGAKMVQKAIEELEDGEELSIDLNSPGGYCSVGAEIYTMLKQCSANGHEVSVNVIGEACSAATVLMCGADNVYASDVAMFMFHNSATTARGKARDMRSALECLEQTDETIVNAYVSKTGKTREELHALIDNETWMSVNKAIEYGFVDGLMFEEEEKEEDAPEDVSTQILDKMQNRVALCMQRIASSSESLIPQDKLELMRKVMIEEMFKETAKNDVLGSNATNINNSLKGGITMTLEEMYEAHPELKDAVEQQVANAVSEAISNERQRIKDIEAISNAVPKDMVEDAKFSHPCDAKELAFNAMQKDAEKAKGYMADAIADNDNSGVNKVKATPDNQGESKDSEADELATFANARTRKGGR